MAKTTINNDALNIFHDGQVLLREGTKLKSRLEGTLMDVFNTKSRQEAIRFSPINMGRLKELHGITIFENDLLNDIRSLVERVQSDVIQKFTEKLCTAIERSSCRKATYHRARHIVRELEKVKKCFQ